MKVLFETGANDRDKKPLDIVVHKENNAIVLVTSIIDPTAFKGILIMPPDYTTIPEVYKKGSVDEFLNCDYRQLRPFEKLIFEGDFNQ